jgi:hypothetical protein
MPCECGHADECDGEHATYYPLQDGGMCSVQKCTKPEPASLRGFGVTITPGGARNWYVGADGVRRWSSNDQPCGA